MIQDFLAAFVENLKQTSILEFIAVVFGIASVWFSKRENILVYPVGLVNTTIYVYLSLKGQLFGEASVNLYYTIMSVYGWYLWTRKDREHRTILHITHSTLKDWLGQLAFFLFFFFGIYFLLLYLKTEFAPGVLPLPDSFASAAAFTGMWMMARKKVESWYWWLITNIISIPLYYVKGYAFTSVYYFILLILAVGGLIEWRKKALIIK